MLKRWAYTYKKKIGDLYMSITNFELLEEIKGEFSGFVQTLQDQITELMVKYDPKIKLTEDNWKREDFAGNPGGGGRTRHFRGDIFESAGVNTSTIFGEIDPQFASKLNGDGLDLWASGISLIIHPLNPHIPTVHANFRFIHQGDRCWFGGGADLTPFIPREEDFSYFHGIWKEACFPMGESAYGEMKKECDHYFVNHHRGTEARGIGGIFFDHYLMKNDLNETKNQVMNLANHFCKSYFPLVEKNRHRTWTKEEEEFQLFRRGRYVEFNLLHDRGTLFGLKTKGRIDSILISLPPRCTFHYGMPFSKNSWQEKMMGYYAPKNW